MSQDLFRNNLLQYFEALYERVSDVNGHWTVKGFIDVYERIYTISLDTKVLSKVLELLMFPVIKRFADEQGYRLELATVQNQYPDITLISTIDENICIAIDIKTTYRISETKVSGMTLGTFAGYFRTRDRPVSSRFAYNKYTKHYVLGVIYSRVENIDERQVYEINNLAEIPSVAHSFQFFLQEKYLIASDIPGSGNTKNIGSTVYLDRLINGLGVFSNLGIEIFDDYWMNYRTKAMAKDEGFEKTPYKNLIEYQAYKKLGSQILTVPIEEIKSEIEVEQLILKEDDAEVPDDGSIEGD